VNTIYNSLKLNRSKKRKNESESEDESEDEDAKNKQKYHDITQTKIESFEDFISNQYFYFLSISQF